VYCIAVLPSCCRNQVSKSRFAGFSLAVIALVLIASPAVAQDWAKKLFKNRDHDFGTVARGAEVEYEFEMVNCYVEDVHISSVRSSCGCTTPIIKKDTLKTWEKGAIVAKLNTRSFLGNKAASIIVTIDKPYFAEVQLQAKARIRGDVVFDPGMINFGEIDQGQGVSKTVSVAYAGRNDWEIVDVRSANTDFEVELDETQRSGGRVSYDMKIRLKDSAPPGYISDQLAIVTNDAHSRVIPLSVVGRVRSNITVSPASLSLGSLSPGETVTKQLIVRGKTPFRIVNVKCDGEGENCFEFNKPSEAKTLQFIPVTYTAGKQPGEVVHNIEIETDQGGTVAHCVATATVR